MNTLENVKVTRCIYRCPFYLSSPDGMECGHPFFKDKGAYDNMIITQDNGRGGKIPPKCPLRNGPLKSETTYSLV